MRWLAVLILAWAPPDASGEKVLEFARSKLGETVGNGQCASLVVEALRFAGAERPRGPSGWGEPLDSLSEARPGDILQFEDARFSGRRVNSNRTITLWSHHFPHHTAIVSARDTTPGALRFRVLHQNARIRGQDQGGAVTEWTIDMATHRSGTVRAYRPIPARSPAGREAAGTPVG